MKLVTASGCPLDAEAAFVTRLRAPVASARCYDRKKWLPNRDGKHGRYPG
jgi:hypothetical protein